MLRVLQASALMCIAQWVSAFEAPSFADYAQKYGKSYTMTEYLERAAVYARNVELLQQHSSEHGFEVGINQFTDMSETDFRDAVLMPRRPNVDHGLEMEMQLSSWKSLPSSWDWRTKNVVSQGVLPVRDQGTVGSCWAFSTAENIEGQVALKTGTLTELSPEYLVDCDYLDCSVFGGWPYNAYKFIMEAGGIPSEQEVPYCSGTGGCYPCMLNPNTTYCGPPPTYCNTTIQKVECEHPEGYSYRANISGWNSIGKNESVIQQALYQRGPLSVLLDATGLQWYSKGVWNPTGWLACDSTGQNLDHAVLLVGWGEDAGVPYWLVKNSWGKSWGEEGYFRIIRGVGRCGINAQVTTSYIH